MNLTRRNYFGCFDFEDKRAAWKSEMDLLSTTKLTLQAQDKRLPCPRGTAWQSEEIPEAVLHPTFSMACLSPKRSRRTTILSLFAQKYCI